MKITRTIKRIESGDGPDVNSVVMQGQIGEWQFSLGVKFLPGYEPTEIIEAFKKLGFDIEAGGRKLQTEMFPTAIRVEGFNLTCEKPRGKGPYAFTIASLEMSPQDRETIFGWRERGVRNLRLVIQEVEAVNVNTGEVVG